VNRQSSTAVASRASTENSAPDAGLFAFVDELKEREKSRNELLDRLSIEEGEEIEKAAIEAGDVGSFRSQRG